MNRYASIISIFLLLFLSSSSLFCESTDTEEDFYEFIEDENAQEEENPEMEVTIRRIKYVVSENINPKWIETLLFIKPGKTLTLRKLKMLINKSQEKLVSMNYFYNVNIYLLPAIEDPHFRTIVVELSDGFWYSFFFQPWDIYIGYNNLFSSGKIVNGIAGLNTQGVSFTDPCFLFSQFNYDVGISHSISLVEEDNSYIKDIIKGTFRPGINMTDTITLSLLFECRYYSFLENYFLYPDFEFDIPEEIKEQLGMEESKFFLYTGPEIEFDFNKPYSSNLIGFKMNIMAYYIHSFMETSESFFKLSGNINVYLNIHPNLTLILRDFAGYNTLSAYPYLQYNFYNHYRGVSDTVLGDYFNLLSFDIVIDDILSFNLGLLKLYFSPFLFADAGKMCQNNEEFAFEDIEFAAGGGIHSYFSMPVNIYLTLGYGMSILPETKPTFILTVSQTIY
ncbi:MAG: hypothetical protein JXB88_17220 [Spirochaetales bacterium]|nr:hypothetical protein [Spirochaetales bacterium]